jgi:hypothetical protein
VPIFGIDAILSLMGADSDPRFKCCLLYKCLFRAILRAAQELDETRNDWLNPPDASEAELKKRTLTNLYNQRPTWLANLHAALDRALWAAYGWEDDPAETSDEVILERLLALNELRVASDE